MNPFVLSHGLKLRITYDKYNNLFIPYIPIMKRITYVLLLITIAFGANALDIPQGTFYFDNSLTNYSTVKFIYGKYSEEESHIVSMTRDEGNRWKVTMPKTETGMYRYTFSNTTLDDGVVAKTFPTLKDEISNTRKEYRTATTSAEILVGGIFKPASGENWAQGSWIVSTNNSYGYSETLPVMFINTTNNVPITSKEEYVTGTYYIDNLGLDGYTSIGTSEEPLTLQIKGRGNYTWVGFDKKPYRLKLDAKEPLLGMKKSKHFALLANADDNLGFLRNQVGFELSRRIGMPWTPDTRPVEVVLNGNYIGLYFLTETIRVDKDRVNIVEQPDLTTNTDSITGGWLVEIDNYDTDPHVQITEGNNERIIFTYKTPEVLSAQQISYLTNQMSIINTALYNTDKNSTLWEEYVDIDRLARFYIIQEIMDNTESFHGSCYMHKDMGDNKWCFGPVWDFGCTFQRNDKKYIYDGDPYGQTWIEEMCKFPRFITKVKELWRPFLGTGYAAMDSYIDQFVNSISTAAKFDAVRWPKYGNSDMESRKASFKSKLVNSVTWLKSKWGEAGVETLTADDEKRFQVIQSDNSIKVISKYNLNSVTLYDLGGRCIAQGNNDNYNVQSGIYIIVVDTEGVISHQKVAVR